MGKVIDVTLKLIDQMTTPLQESTRQLSKAGKEIEKMGKSITNTGATLTKSITVPLVGAGTVAVTKFAEVDKTMTLVNETMQNTTEEAALLNKAMQDAAMNSTFGMSDAATAALNFARGGWDAEQAADALQYAMGLAAGEGGTLDTVSNGLMATMNAFGASSSEAEGYTDALAAACNNSALEIDSLVSSMSIAAPVFKSGGSNVQDLLVAMGTMADNGVDANTAATALKTGIARLAAPAADASAWMEKLGISAFDANGSMKDMVTLQSELSGAFSTLSEQEQEAAASAIFGKNQMSNWLTLINASPDKVAELNEQLQNAGGTTEAMAEAMMSGFGGSLEKLKSSIDVLVTTFGSTLAPYVSSIADKVQTTVDAFNALSDEQKDQVVRWAMMAAAVGPVLMIFGKVVTSIGSIVKVASSIGKAAKLMSKMVSAGSSIGSILAAIAGPGAIVVGVLAAIAVAAVLVYKNWDKIKATGEKLLEYLQPKFEAFKDTLGTAFQTVSEKVHSVFSACGVTMEWFMGLITPVINAVMNLGSVIMGIYNEKIRPAIQIGIQKFQEFCDMISNLWAIAQPVITKIGTVASDVFGVVLEGAVKGAIDTFQLWAEIISTVITGAIDYFTGLIEFVTGVFTGDWELAWTGVKDTFSAVWDTITGVLQSFYDWATGLLDGLFGTIANLVTKIAGAKSETESTAAGTGTTTAGANATGTSYWKGGITQVNERGAEIIDLPRGSRIYPHSTSLDMAYNAGKNESSGGSKSVSINIQNLAGSLSVRSDADIDSIVQQLSDKLEKVADNLGGADIGYIY